MSTSIFITVKAVDQATNVIRSIAASVIKLGETMLQISKKVMSGATSLVGGIFQFLTSIKTLFAGALAIVGARAIAHAFIDTANAMKEIGIAADDVGISANAMSVLKYQAESANMSFDELKTGIKSLIKGLAEVATTGDGPALRALDTLGIAIKNTDGRFRSVADLLPDIAEAMNGIDDPVRRAAFGAALFGKNFQEMDRILREGGPRLRAIAEEGKKIGAIYSNEQIAIAGRFSDAIERLGKAWEGLWAQLVQKIGPQLSEWVDYLTLLISVVPDILHNIITAVREAANNPEQATLFKAFGMSLLDIVRAIGLSAGSMFVAAIYDGAKVSFFLIKRLKDELSSWFQDIFYDMVEQSIKIKAWLGENGFGIYNKEFIASQEEALRARRRVAKQQELSDTQEMFRDIKTALSEPELLSNMAFEQAVSDISQAIHGAWVNADQLFKIIDAINAHKIQPLPERPQSNRAEPPVLSGKQVHDSWDPSEFWKGMKIGLGEFIDAANDAAAQGKALATGVARSLTDNLSTAISSVIQGVHSLKDAFRTFLSSTLSQISDLIVRMMVLRAIGGIAQSFGGEASWANLAASSGKNRGGLVQPLHFAGGGFVPGPGYINRDIVPAMLTPGEYVVSQRGRQANRAGDLEYINRGGNARDLGGGGGVTVNVTVNVQGGNGSSGSLVQQAQQVGQAAFQGVLKALKMNPGNRDELRRVLA